MQTIDVYNEFITGIYKDHSYFSFGLICLGFEFMGKILSDNMKPKGNDGRDGFNLAMEKLTDGSYKTAITEFDLYGSIRNGLLHNLRPKDEKFWLRNTNTLKNGDTHLGTTIINDKVRIVLVIEDFYETFQQAIEKLRVMYRNGEITNRDIDTPLIMTEYPK